jgi:hypothetical protein
LTFLEPPRILDVLTMPISQDWMNTFTRQPELWRVLCLLEPFKARIDDDADSADEAVEICPFNAEVEGRRTFGRFRMLYTSVVRCMKYLARIKEDATSGRSPSVIDFSGLGTSHRHEIGSNHNLQRFLARARGAAIRHYALPVPDVGGDDIINNFGGSGGIEWRAASRKCLTRNWPAKRKRNGTRSHNERKTKPQALQGPSDLTQRLLGPSRDGAPGALELPWSCAIYSIVNWMIAFSGVEGIQTMCLKVLPTLLEDEQQRIIAQRAGLTSVVLRAMVMFPESASLNAGAFHTIVLLARPLGGREGMLFHTSMLNSSGIFSAEPDSGQGAPSNGKNGIAVMLDSMRRFQQDEFLQAMSCWSLVNIALAPAQKEALVHLGGVRVTANAMLAHPYSAEVQFRALFALINLVIPSVSLHPSQGQDRLLRDEQATNTEAMDGMVDQVISLVVLAMKNFCASEAIVNRACLVLHNLSLTPEYHQALLWSPYCYQMLEWCLANYRNDQVLQQSAAGTMQRLQMTLSSSESLKARFAASLKTEQQQNLEQAHHEALLLHEQHSQQQPPLALE